MNDLFSRQDASDLVAAASRLDRARIADQSATRPFSVQQIVLDLSTACDRTQPYRIGFPFKSLFVQDASDVFANVSCVLGSNDSLQSPFKLKHNASIEMDHPVNEAFLFWEAQAGKSMTLIAFVEARFRTGSQISVSGGGVSINDGSTATLSSATLAATTATEIAAADTQRKKASIYNDTGDTLYLGPDNTVTDSTGIPLADGNIIYWQNTAALYGYSVAGGDIRKLEEK